MKDNNLLLEHYKESVALKYQIYNAMFLTLPFEEMKDVDAEVLTFQDYSRRGIQSGMSPDAVVNSFFQDTLHHPDFEYKIKLLFLLMQFLERDVVLLDALEDAAFPVTHELKGAGSLTHYLSNMNLHSNADAVYEFLKKYRTRIVLTAHPTQFYPFQVLEIIEDLSKATKSDELPTIANLLLQLGKTSFKNPTRLTPIEEAEVHIYYLERHFYPVMKSIQCELRREFADKGDVPTVLELGFWPGGDRDGNPNITPEITLMVAKKLKSSIIERYLQDIHRLKRRLTFPNMWPTIDKIEHRLVRTQRQELHTDDETIQPYDNVEAFLSDLLDLRNVLMTQHNGLFSEKLDDVITAVQTFGFHFASMDLRQDSRVHTQVVQKLLGKLSALTVEEVLARLDIQLDEAWVKSDPLVYDVLGSLKASAIIQKANGEQGLHRYIISNTQAVTNILDILFLAHCAGLPNNHLKLDIVPLFETIADLNNAQAIMEHVFQSPVYQQHLKQRSNRQYVMLGFSDGTKDGGYFMANFAILQCKIRLFKLAQRYNINIQFFDGRGGSEARGGGNTYKFYRAISQEIDIEHIHVTIQGQTISSDFGSQASARYKIEQLLLAGLPHANQRSRALTDNQIHLLQALSKTNFDAYTKLKNDPLFVPYLEKVTPILFYGDLNNASRPPRRNDSGGLQLKDLRAIPFVGAWSQAKQNVPVYFGIGTAIQNLMVKGQEESLKNMYRDSLFFRTLIDNAMQSLLKTNFALTQYLKNDSKFAAFWMKLSEEAELTVAMLKKITGHDNLLHQDPVTKASIALRENIVIPLAVIQQYALIEFAKSAPDSKEASIFRKLILKSLAASTNASRNST